MKFNSQICTTIEQSERLIALGLRMETADMRYDCIGRMSDTEMIYREKPIIGPVISYYDIPAWSLHRLIEMYVERYISCSMNLKDLTYEWIINEIEIHIKEGDFNKEYLENEMEEKA